MELIRSFLRAERGATAVEYAFVAPVMLSLMFGVVEMGRLVFAKSVISHSMAETSRWAFTAMSPDTVDQASIRNFLIDGAALGANLTAAEVEVTPSGGPCPAAGQVDIVVSHSFDSLFTTFVPIGAVVLREEITFPLQCLE